MLICLKNFCFFDDDDDDDDDELMAYMYVSVLMRL